MCCGADGVESIGVRHSIVFCGDSRGVLTLAAATQRAVATGAILARQDALVCGAGSTGGWCSCSCGGGVFSSVTTNAR